MRDRKIKVFIIAGGRGERLVPLTNSIPKPMIKIDEKSILEHTIAMFKYYGFKDFLISVHYLADKIKTYFGDGKKFGVQIKYIVEEIPLGTAGSVSLARKFIKDTFIISYADILRNLNINKMLNFHFKKKALATLNVYKRFGQDAKSKIIFNKDYRILNFQERPKYKSVNDDFVWSNASLYIFEPEILKYIKENKFQDFGKDIFPKLLKDKGLFAYPCEDYFIDIGNIEKLKLAKKDLKIGRFKPYDNN